VYDTAYIDAPVMRWYDSDLDGTADEQYYLSDASFSVIALLNNAGTVIERYRYTPYGQRIVMTASFTGSASTSSYGNDRGFQGLLHDTESGLIENRARMLDPMTGRFIQRDPLGYPDGLNTYAAYHVLWGGVDPFGLSTGTYKAVSVGELEKKTYTEFVKSGLHESVGAIGDVSIEGAIEFSKETNSKLGIGLNIGGSIGKALIISDIVDIGISVDRQIAQNVASSFSLNYDVFEIMAGKGYWEQQWSLGVVTVLWEENGKGESINVATYGEKVYGDGFEVAPNGIKVIDKNLETDGCDWILAEVTYRNALSKREFIETDEAIGTGKYVVRVRGSNELVGHVGNTSDAMILAQQHFKGKHSTKDMIDAIKKSMIP